MILLFNLNKYIGGGETLLIRVSSYLELNNINYLILTHSTDCWLLNEAKRLKLKYVLWPCDEDSVIYQSDDKRRIVANKIYEIFQEYEELRVFTFCMRDLYNALFYFPKLKSTRVYIAHGIYHPMDVYYLSSYSLFHRKIVKMNRTLFYELHNKKSILFMNKIGLQSTLSPEPSKMNEVAGNSIFIPIPCPNIVRRKAVKKKVDTSKRIRIICISRFASFKIAAVLSILKYVKNRSNVDLIVIGHGPWKFLLDFWIYSVNAKNVEIICNVSPNELDRFIDTCDIGYAQGTSILEIAKRGLPVIVAPYTRLIDIFKRSIVTPGIFGDVAMENEFGDGGVWDVSSASTIDSCVLAIVENYEYYQEKSMQRLVHFSGGRVCREIIYFIQNSEFIITNRFSQLPKAPFVKSIIRYFLKFAR